MTNIQATIETLAKITSALKIVEEAFLEYEEYMEDKNIQFSYDELLRQDPDWREIYDFGKGYLAGLAFCIKRLTE